MLTKRLVLSLLAVATITLLVSGASLALFTANTPNDNNVFASGTVSLDDDALIPVPVNPMAPGDSGSGTYKVTYTGNLDAWMGLSTTLAGDLTTCDGVNRLVVKVKDAHDNSYTLNTTDQVIMDAAHNPTPVTMGTEATFTVEWELDIDTTNACQGKTATLGMQVKAVQSRNNTNGGGTGPNSWS